MPIMAIIMFALSVTIYEMFAVEICATFGDDHDGKAKKEIEWSGARP